MDEMKSFMKEALKEAEKAFEKGEVPVGAVLVHDGKIIARAHNEVESQRDASAHAEMLCIKRGAHYLKNWRLEGATLYSTLEPCAMCAGALLLSRIETLVWGAKDLRHGADGSFIDLLSRKHPTHEIKVHSGVLQEESAALMRSFFQKRRKENSQQEELFDQLILSQQEKMLSCAKRIVPHVIQDDLLQPNDFPALENHPHFRYEEGILEGLLTARMAYLAKQSEG
ncbi:MAG: nucleoside deaminase [Chlamydiales bacterium]|nr:nucleoside deaminase [Chlamydiales bacterium]